MDLIALHSMMSRKKFHYFEGKTNDRENNLYLTFSTVHNGMGNSVDIRIGDIDNDINCYIYTTNIELKNVGDNEIFRLIEERC
jgi:hypothetical protein